ncbi:carboxymuconolactone decarboxylase family protein [Mycolicibacterium sp. F2034L]|uniref:carboxymuconolactone decarboxylase family protein n=1 Tax=Mycolicibacterium sp. F2034L TaxID=2926422 RepID=UPI001FF1AFEC|nr:carboxymuconolactone decarboxylase family protein [Mycolicibacterium sp. F2034L]MCK0176581.1 carboxymuconolactone decarboxylase family protein [Mycolicibacterium sp. F2034L]
MSRLAPLPGDEWSDETRAALRSLLPEERRNPDDAGDLLSRLLRHPGLTHAYLTFNAHVLRHSTLSDRVREVAVLRAVHHRGCAYLWHHHIPIAHRAGLTDSEIESLRAGSPADPTDRLVVRAVDELRERDTLTDAIWQALSEAFDERQRMDLVFTIGCYDLLAAAVNAFGIEPD